MAKKRTTDPEPRISTGAAPARQPRKRSVKASSPAPSAPSTPVAETSAAAAPEPPRAPEYTPSAEEIARLAYSYWLARGGHGGSPEEDWLRAERELRHGRSLEAGAA